MESAIALVFNAKPKPHLEEIERAAAGVFEKLNAYGVTSIQTGQANAADLEAFRKLESEGRLTIRIRTNWDFNTPLAPVSPEQMLERFDTRDERGPVSNLINPDGGKIYADGSRSVASPYLEPYASAPPTVGRRSTKAA
jgi:predicted amidohydrolase YtcJ